MVPFLIGIGFLLFGPAIGDACSIMNPEPVQVGSFKGVKGTCSNNKMPVSCIMMEGTGIECDGPGGGFEGRDLENLIDTACACSREKETERELKQDLEIK